MMGNCHLLTEGKLEILQSVGGTSNRPNWVEFKPVSFADVTGISLRASGEGILRLRSNSYQLLAEFSVDTDSFTVFTSPISTTHHADKLWITFEGKEMKLLDFTLLHETET